MENRGKHYTARGKEQKHWESEMSSESWKHEDFEDSNKDRWDMNGVSYIGCGEAALKVLALLNSAKPDFLALLNNAKI